MITIKCCCLEVKTKECKLKPILFDFKDFILTFWFTFLYIFFVINAHFQRWDLQQQVTLCRSQNTPPWIISSGKSVTRGMYKHRIFFYRYQLKMHLSPPFGEVMQWEWRLLTLSLWVCGGLQTDLCDTMFPAAIVPVSGTFKHCTSSIQVLSTCVRYIILDRL